MKGYKWSMGGLIMVYKWSINAMNGLIMVYKSPIDGFIMVYKCFFFPIPYRSQTTVRNQAALGAPGKLLDAGSLEMSSHSAFQDLLVFP